MSFKCVCSPENGCFDEPRGECVRVGMCLGSEEGIAYQERNMKAFFNWLFAPDELPATDGGTNAR